MTVAVRAARQKQFKSPLVGEVDGLALPRKRGREQARSAATPSDVLLAWYDRHRRRLPWRAGPGERPAPYRVWLSEIMLQQTTVKAVGPYYAKFLARWPSVRRSPQPRSMTC